MRYLYLHAFGGIYADLDFVCLKSFDSLLAGLDREADVVLGQLGSDIRWLHSIPNALMISKPAAPFWLYCIRVMLDCERRSSQSPEVSTGPCATAHTSTLPTTPQQLPTTRATRGTL